MLRLQRIFAFAGIGACLALLLTALPPCAGARETALGPQWARYYVAAGLGEAGYADGTFAAAEFQAPGGLVLSKDGSLLYVADTDNNAVRRVWLGKDEQVDTLCGGPNSAALSSPTALALSLDETSLFVVDSKRGVVLRLPSSGGTPQPVFLTLSPTARNLSATALVRNPTLNVLYAWNAPEGALYALDATNGQAVRLGKLADLAGVDGTLACTNQQLFLLRRDNGELVRFLYGGQGMGLAGSAWTPAQTLSWNFAGGFGTGARGIVARLDENQRWAVWIWDQDKGLFKVVDPTDGAVTNYPLRDYKGNWLMPTTLYQRAPFADDPLLDATTRPLMRGPLALVDDPAHNQIYAAETEGNRVLGLGTPPWDRPRDDQGDQGGTMDYRCGAKIPGVTRVLVLGDSMVLSDDPDSGDHYTVETGFGKQLQLWLNLFSALNGKNRRFQVLQCSVPLGAMGAGVTSFMINMPQPLKNLKPDAIVTLLTYMNIDAELSGMTDTRCPDDACWAYPDPAYAAQDLTEMMGNYGPLHRDFLKWIKSSASPFVRAYTDTDAGTTGLVLPRGRFFVAPLQDPGFDSWVLKLQDKLDRISADAARKEGVTRYTQVLLPMRQQLAPGENVGGGIDFSEPTQNATIDEGLAKAASHEGVNFINLTKPLRQLEPTVFPVVAYGSHHYRTRGLAWAAMITAWQYVQQLP